MARKRTIRNQFADSKGRRFPMNSITQANNSLASIAREVRNRKLSSLQGREFKERIRRKLDRLMAERTIEGKLRRRFRD